MRIIEIPLVEKLICLFNIALYAYFLYFLSGFFNNGFDFQSGRPEKIFSGLFFVLLIWTAFISCFLLLSNKIGYYHAIFLNVVYIFWLSLRIIVNLKLNNYLGIKYFFKEEVYVFSMIFILIFISVNHNKIRTKWSVS